MSDNNNRNRRNSSSSSDSDNSSTSKTSQVETPHENPPTQAQTTPQPEAGSAQFKSKYIQSTQTTSLQSQTEYECAPFFISIPDLPRAHINDLIRLSLIDPKTYHILLLREKHASYIQRPLQEKKDYMLPSGYLSLDASRPWILYWTLHSLDLLNELPSGDTLKGIVHTLEACWSDVKVKSKGQSRSNGGGGGFGGGVGQMPHCATSYAAVMALCIISGCGDNDELEYQEAKHMATDLLQRKRSDLLKWYLTLRYETKDENNAIMCGYRMHHDGEVDVRATFCICAVASLLNIFTDDLKYGMMEHIVSCQTYEGGFGGEPGVEAHGGYTFCALSALHMLIKDSSSFISLKDSGVDTESLEDWLVRRQMGYEGGFNGRTNKLVDGCYTFWVGGAIAILDLNRNPPIQQSSSSSSPDNNCPYAKFDSGVYVNGSDPFQVQRPYYSEEEKISHVEHTSNKNNIDFAGNLTFDQELLQRYTLLCAQDPNGGLRDKPSKGRDFYHSCYNLSGLSVSQHVLFSEQRQKQQQGSGLDDVNEVGGNCMLYQEERQNILGATHPVYNIRIERVRTMIQLFSSSI